MVSKLYLQLLPVFFSATHKQGIVLLITELPLFGGGEKQQELF
jgi:hypothetical protein